MTENQLNQFPTPPASSPGANPEQFTRANPANNHTQTQTPPPAIEVK